MEARSGGESTSPRAGSHAQLTYDARSLPVGMVPGPAGNVEPYTHTRLERARQDITELWPDLVEDVLDCLSEYE